jgi:UTP--glucose-1-phosphate uridylyltransferase
MSSLDDALAGLSSALRERLARGAFDAGQLVRWATEVSRDRDATNRLDAVEPPSAGDVIDLPAPGSAEHARLSALGHEALSRGEVALLVLSGGMATRMGSVVKALVEALPGKTFLDLRLAERAHVSATHGADLPLWLMTSEATDGPIRAALGARLDREHVAAFPQNVSLRLTRDGELYRDASGEPSLYPTGHGDVPDALRRSGLLDGFRARGGKHVWIANLDNLGATVDPLVLGWHIDGGAALGVEVVDKAGDKGGIPVRYRGKAIVCEDFRLPLGFDAASVPVFNTNTFLARADALASYDAPFTYCLVEKKVDGQAVIQRERLLGELTFHLPTRFVHVPRTGSAARFLPVKDPEELAKRRPDLEVVCRERGMLGSA